MADRPKERHSRPWQQPVTIDLDPKDVERVELGADEAGSTEDGEPAAKAPEEPGGAAPADETPPDQIKPGDAPGASAAAGDAARAEATRDGGEADPQGDMPAGGSGGEKPEEAAGDNAAAAEKPARTWFSPDYGEDAKAAQPGSSGDEDDKAGGGPGAPAATRSAFGRDAGERAAPAGAAASKTEPRGGGASALLAGIAGGVIVVLVAGGLYWAGVIPAGTGQNAGAAIQGLQSGLDALKSDLADTRKIADGAANTSGLQDAISQNHSSIDDLGKTVAALKSDLDALKSSVAAGGNGAAPDLGPLQDRLARLETEVQNLHNASGTAGGQDLTEVDNRIADLESKVSGLSDALAQQNGLSSQLADLEQNLSATSTKVQSLADTAQAASQAAQQASDAAGNVAQQAQSNAGRLDALEKTVSDLSGRMTAQASQPNVALAIAASALKSAIDRGAPFSTELDTYAALAPKSQAEDIAALRDIAKTGVPTRAAIAAEADAAADRMVEAARGANPDTGFFGRLLASAQSIIKVRPVGMAEGDSPAAVVARMEAAVKDGDYTACDSGIRQPARRSQNSRKGLHRQREGPPAGGRPGGEGARRGAAARGGRLTAMLRVLSYVILVFVLGAGFAWLAERPGDMVVTFNGYRYEVSLMVAAVLVVALVAAVMIVWWLLRSIWNSPTTVARYFRVRRRDRGYQALSTGMIAAGAGDAALARKKNREAMKLISADQEPLLNLLDAQASLLEGDRQAAREKFEAMLDDPEMRLLGLHGLYLEANRLGEHEAARHYAGRAVEIAPQLGWAAEATLERRCAEGDWDGALKLLDAQGATRQIDARGAGQAARRGAGGEGDGRAQRRSGDSAFGCARSQQAGARPRARGGNGCKGAVQAGRDAQGLQAAGDDLEEAAASRGCRGLCACQAGRFGAGPPGARQKTAFDQAEQSRIGRRRRSRRARRRRVQGSARGRRAAHPPGAPRTRLSADGRHRGGRDRRPGSGAPLAVEGRARPARPRLGGRWLCFGTLGAGLADQRQARRLRMARADGAAGRADRAGQGNGRAAAAADIRGFEGTGRRPLRSRRYRGSADAAGGGTRFGAGKTGRSRGGGKGDGAGAYAGRAGRQARGGKAGRGRACAKTGRQRCRFAGEGRRDGRRAAGRAGKARRCRKSRRGRRAAPAGRSGRRPRRGQGRAVRALSPLLKGPAPVAGRGEEYGRDHDRADVPALVRPGERGGLAPCWIAFASS